MYISSSYFVYLCVPCYCDAYLKSSALHVGVKTLHNTILHSLFILWYNAKQFLLFAYLPADYDTSFWQIHAVTCFLLFTSKNIIVSVSVARLAEWKTEQARCFSLLFGEKQWSISSHECWILWSIRKRFERWELHQGQNPCCSQCDLNTVTLSRVNSTVASVI